MVRTISQIAVVWLRIDQSFVGEDRAKANKTVKSFALIEVTLDSNPYLHDPAHEFSPTLCLSILVSGEVMKEQDALIGTVEKYPCTFMQGSTYVWEDMVPNTKKSLQRPGHKGPPGKKQETRSG